MVLTQGEYETLCPNLSIGTVVGDIPGAAIVPSPPADPTLTAENVDAAFALFDTFERNGYFGIARQVGLTKAQVITLYGEYLAAIAAKIEQEGE